MSAKYTSRFFYIDDVKKNHFIFDLHPEWWSRPYEYAWASEFAERKDIALDAASGICHPLKFYLSDNCKEVHACDADKRILSSTEILNEISDVFGKKVAKNFSDEYFTKIHYTNASIMDTTYEDGTFDKIYCISVLEHLDDTLNKSPNLSNLGIFKKLFSHDIYLSLIEFKRILKDDGLIIVTFDYPRINFKYLKKIFLKIGLKFAGDVSFEIPENAVYSKENYIYCFRAVLRKELKND